ncbi:MAG TPA: type 4a pilus biogenesis protein PilO [Acidimicrobiales bacterium]|nr:type 4a pilus biogenesis protein PilO [Acidimicrobiales bacterium]
METVNRFRTPILTGAGLLVFAIIVFAALISPQSTKLSKLHAQETQLQTQQASLVSQLAILRRDKAHMAANCAALATALDQVPGTPSVDSFLQQVTNLAVASGDPNTPTIAVTQAPGGKATGGVTPVQVTMTLQGTYGQMSAFLKGLDGFPRLFTVTSVNVTGGAIAAGGGAINPSTGGYDLTLTGAVYYSLGLADPCGGAKTPGNNAG